MNSKIKEALAQMEANALLIEEISRTQNIIDNRLNLALPAGKFVPYKDFEALPEMKWIEFWKGTRGIKLPTINPDVIRFYCEYSKNEDEQEEVLPHYHDCLEKLITLGGQLYRTNTDLPIEPVTLEQPYTMHAFYVKGFTKAIVEFYRPRPQAE